MAAARRAADEGADGVHYYPHGTIFRHDRDTGLLDQSPFLPLNWGTDSFQFVRQNGFQGWLATVTLLSMSPQDRTWNKYPLLLVVTPGPRQPVSLESVLYRIAEELDVMTKGVPGLMVPNSAKPVLLRARVLNCTTDQPGGGKLSRFTGVSSYVYNRLRSIAASASEVENTCAAGKSVAYKKRLQQKTGVKGFSLFFAPSLAMRAAYLHLEHLW